MDGYGVLEELRKDPAGATIPFIFLTAKTDKSDVREGMGRGADDYLTKPFTATELITSVKARLNRKAQYDDRADEKLGELRENIILSLPHELRTPLTGILGFSDLLVLDSASMPSDKIAELAQYIHSAALRLYRLTESYLAYATLEVTLTDKERVASIRKLTTTKPRVVIEDEAIQKAQTQQRESDLVLRVDECQAVGIAEDNLRKIVGEVVDNAFKFSDPGTAVEVVGTVKDHRYVISVSDKGRGMKPAQIKAIGAYMQFGRGLYEQQGSGFGLAIVKRLADLHGAGFEVTSTLEKETSVEISLALVDVPVADEVVG
jgi:signal transduction histidine kinase